MSNRKASSQEEDVEKRNISAEDEDLDKRNAHIAEYAKKKARRKCEKISSIRHDVKDIDYFRKFAAKKITCKIKLSKNYRVLFLRWSIL